MTPLILPAHIAEDPEPELICTVTLANGETCGAAFTRTQHRKYAAHVAQCATQNLATIRAESLKERMPIFDDDAWDPEISKHMREVGRRMIREKRLEVLPSEKAGF
jgi:ABC-type histidine transport system ATPase subunit